MRIHRLGEDFGDLVLVALKLVVRERQVAGIAANPQGIEMPLAGRGLERGAVAGGQRLQRIELAQRHGNGMVEPRLLILMSHARGHGGERQSARVGDWPTQSAESERT